MSILDIFFKKKRVGGLIGIYGLDDWWLDGLTEAERERIVYLLRTWRWGKDALTIDNSVTKEVYKRTKKVDFLGIIKTRLKKVADKELLNKVEKEIEKFDNH